jgi:hypothetical protein
MAQVIDQPFESRKGRPPKYPWTAEDAQTLGHGEHWTDGKTRVLRRGHDFEADLISFRTMVHRKARDLGAHIGAYTHINKADQSIKVRFYTRDEG